jgi:hypothetical protein
VTNGGAGRATLDGRREDDFYSRRCIITPGKPDRDYRVGGTAAPAQSLIWLKGGYEIETYLYENLGGYERSTVGKQGRKIPRIYTIIARLMWPRVLRIGKGKRIRQ